MSLYRKGRAHEYAVAKKYREMGYVVLRSAGSHGLFDLIALRLPGWYEGEEFTGHMAKFIQCKVGKSAKREIKKVLDSDIKKFEGLYAVRVEVV